MLETFHSSIHILTFHQTLIDVNDQWYFAADYRASAFKKKEAV